MRVPNLWVDTWLQCFSPQPLRQYCLCGYTEEATGEAGPRLDHACLRRHPGLSAREWRVKGTALRSFLVRMIVGMVMCVSVTPRMAV